MSQEQNSTISGTVYDKYTPASQEYKEGRMPRIGQVCHFEDGRSFVFCQTFVGLYVNDVVAAADPKYDGTGGLDKAVARGTREVLCTMSGNITNGELDEGFIQVRNQTTTPYIQRLYKVKKTKVISGKQVLFTLYDSIQEALDIGTKLTAFPARARNTVRGQSTNNGIGLAMAECINGEESYIWVQYKGEASSNQQNVNLGAGMLTQDDGGKLTAVAAVTDVPVAIGDKNAGLSPHLWLCFPNI